MACKYKSSMMSSTSAKWEINSLLPSMAASTIEEDDGSFCC
eukprot:CAMPEP_0183778802 /NCGR_PEP_ID=MMETSP0739-20130205/52379_1 /TAXON_ID=385413 /ORGANISM="Thalassiosira miniscula, Strain CCMP1093" /LENGTH=40 /DNA_ID= /DNA_START= /DNA_END= /DNA_ORIENTATION=